MPLDLDVRASVADADEMVVGEMPSTTSATVLDDAVSHQRAVSLLREAQVVIGSRRMQEAERRRTAYATLTKASERLEEQVLTARARLDAAARRLG
jgi:hypothetical protein